MAINDYQTPRVCLGCGLAIDGESYLPSGNHACAMCLGDASADYYFKKPSPSTFTNMGEMTHEPMAKHLQASFPKTEANNYGASPWIVENRHTLQDGNTEVDVRSVCNHFGLDFENGKVRIKSGPISRSAMMEDLFGLVRKHFPIHTEETLEPPTTFGGAVDEAIKKERENDVWSRIDKKYRG